MKVLINGSIEIDPAQRERALKEAAPLIEMARTEAGCLAYNWGADLSNEKLIYVYEEWASEKDLDVHFTVPSYTKMLEHLSGCGLVSADVRKFRVDKECGVYNPEGLPTSEFF